MNMKEICEAIADGKEMQVNKGSSVKERWVDCDIHTAITTNLSYSSFVRITPNQTTDFKSVHFSQAIRCWDCEEQYRVLGITPKLITHRCTTCCGTGMLDKITSEPVRAFANLGD